MATMFPNTFPKGLIEYLRGEAKVFEALKTQFDKNWVVFTNVLWSQSVSDSSIRDCETDFIISHPDENYWKCPYLVTDYENFIYKSSLYWDMSFIFSSISNDFFVDVKAVIFRSIYD